MSGAGVTDEADYLAPESVEAARAALDGEGQRRVVAGGQSLSLLVRQGFVDADAFVDVSGVDALSGVSVEHGRATVGATTTYSDLADTDLSDRVAMLGDACSVVADRQVRNLGTVGGALAHADPALDLLAPLLCLDATVQVGSVDGSRTVALSEFLVGHMRTDLGASELLEAVTFAVPEGASAYEKHARTAEGWATVGVAAQVELAEERFETVRVGLTAVGETALRAPTVEAKLAGEAVSADSVAAASEAVVEDVDPIDDGAGSAAYKRELAVTLTERALGRAVERAGGAL